MKAQSFAGVPSESNPETSDRTKLELLNTLSFHPAAVDVGLAALEQTLKSLPPPKYSCCPRQVFLFSGHMIDEPGRSAPRFPANKETIALQKIAVSLDQSDAGPEDLALTQGACGGDLLFSEACQQRGVNVQWLQPFFEAEFIQNSVLPCGEAWRNRYLNVRSKLTLPLRAAPEELGDPPRNAGHGYPYQRCNLWLLYTALAWGVGKIHFICLWNGGGGDGPGGTAHMYHQVKQLTGQVTWIDTRDF